MNQTLDDVEHAPKFDIQIDLTMSTDTAPSSKPDEGTSDGDQSTVRSSVIDIWRRRGSESPKSMAKKESAQSLESLKAERKSPALEEKKEEEPQASFRDMWSERTAKVGQNVAPLTPVTTKAQSRRSPINASLSSEPADLTILPSRDTVTQPLTKRSSVAGFWTQRGLHNIDDDQPSTVASAAAAQAQALVTRRRTSVVDIWKNRSSPHEGQPSEDDLQQTTQPPSSPVVVAPAFVKSRNSPRGQPIKTESSFFAELTESAVSKRKDADSVIAGAKASLVEPASLGKASSLTDDGTPKQSSVKEMSEAVVAHAKAALHEPTTPRGSVVKRWNPSSSSKSNVAPWVKDSSEQGAESADSVRNKVDPIPQHFKPKAEASAQVLRSGEPTEPASQNQRPSPVGASATPAESPSNGSVTDRWTKVVQSKPSVLSKLPPKPTVETPVNPVEAWRKALKPVKTNVSQTRQPLESPESQKPEKEQASDSDSRFESTDDDASASTAPSIRDRLKNASRYRSKAQQKRTQIETTAPPAKSDDSEEWGTSPPAIESERLKPSMFVPKCDQKAAKSQAVKAKLPSPARVVKKPAPIQVSDRAAQTKESAATGVVLSKSSAFDVVRKPNLLSDSPNIKKFVNLGRKHVEHGALGAPIHAVGAKHGEDESLAESSSLFAETFTSAKSGPVLGGKHARDLQLDSQQSSDTDAVEAPIAPTKNLSSTARLHLPAPMVRRPKPKLTAPKPLTVDTSLPNIDEVGSNDSTDSGILSSRSRELSAKKKELLAQRRRSRTKAVTPRDKYTVVDISRNSIGSLGGDSHTDENIALTSEYTPFHRSPSVDPGERRAAPSSPQGSEANLSFLSIDSGLSPPSAVSVGSTLTNRAERALQQRRRRGKAGDKGGTPQSSKKMKSKAERVRSPGRDRYAHHPDGGPVKVSRASKKRTPRKSDSARLFKRYHTASRFVEPGETPMTSPQGSVEISFTMQSMESSFPSGGTATTESDSHFRSKGSDYLSRASDFNSEYFSRESDSRVLSHESESHAPIVKKIEKKTKSARRRSSPVGIASEQFLAESAANVDAFESACKGWSLKEIASDWVGEMQLVNLHFSQVNDKLNLVCSASTPSKACRDLVPFDEEDVAIEVEFMDEDSTIERGDNNDDDEENEDGGDPRKDLGVFAPIDDALGVAGKNMRSPRCVNESSRGSFDDSVSKATKQTAYV